MQPNKSVLITGSSGFVGGALSAYLTQKGYEVVGVDITPANGSAQCDVSDSPQLRDILKGNQPDIVVHCAARKNLPDCEDNKAAAFATNSLSTETIAEFAKRNQTKIIYLSSDVVFDGKIGDYEPSDPVKPINWYGKTKAFSEIILKSVPNVAICRTALVIGKLNADYQAILDNEIKNDVLVNQTLLPQYIYRRLRNNQSVRLPSTIISNPTPVDLLCEVIGKVIELDTSGIIHATGPDPLSRFETALLIADSFGFDRKLVIEDDSNISPLRPRNISMNTEETFRSLGLDADNWRMAKYLSSEGLYA